MPRSIMDDNEEENEEESEIDGWNEGEAEIEGDSGTESEAESESIQHPRQVDRAVDGGTVTDTDSEMARAMDRLAISADTEANIRAFVQRLQQMLPLVDNVSIHLGHDPSNLCENADYHFSSLVTQLYQLANQFEFAVFSPSLPMELRTDDIHELVKFTYHDNVNDTSRNAWVTLVARRSAATLQSLHLIVQRRISFLDVIQDSDRGYISYPCLTVLQLQLYSYEQDAPISVTPGVVLFPSLRHLLVASYYPFDDDSLFRGNAKTLEQLGLSTGPKLRDILLRYNVFTYTSHPNLRYFRTFVLTYSFLSYFESAEDFMDYALSIAHGVSVLELYGASIGDGRFPRLLMLKHFTRIQILNVFDTQVPLWQLEKLMQELPLLSELSCRSTKLDIAIETWDLARFAGMMVKRRGPGREQFRYWRIARENDLGETDGNISDTVLCVIGVALFCPNFTYAAVSNSSHEEYMAYMELYINLPGLSPYASSLKRLLFSRTINN